jgi:hypothetical protein
VSTADHFWCGRHSKLRRQMPTGLIKQQRGVAAGCDLACYLGEMQVHRLSVAGRRNERRAFAVAWADGAKDIGRGSALIARRRGAGAAACPTAGDLVLLANARLVGKPDLYVVRIDPLLLRDGFQLRVVVAKSNLCGVGVFGSECSRKGEADSRWGPWRKCRGFRQRNGLFRPPARIPMIRSPGVI